MPHSIARSVRAPILVLSALAAVACSQDVNNPTSPTSLVSAPMALNTAEGEAVVTVCKNGPTGSTATFSIQTSVGQLLAGSTFTLVANADPALAYTGCKTVWKAGAAGVSGTVTVTEIGMSSGVEFERAVYWDATGYHEVVAPLNSVTLHVTSTLGALAAFKNIPVETPPGFAGCTPGFWRQTQHFPYWTGYAPGDAFSTVFGVARSGTLLQNVWAGGGGANALARHAVAALLNSASAEVDYPYTTAQVIAAVQSAFATGSFESTKNQFEAANELGCTVDKSRD